MKTDNAEREMFNAAFLGYSLAIPGGLFVRCCAACPGKPLVERWAAAGTRTPVSHGLCATHFQQQMNQITRDKSDEHGN